MKKPSLRTLGLVLLIATAAGFGLYYFFAVQSPPVQRVGEGRAALVDPLAETIPNPAFAENLKSYFDSVGMVMDQYTGTEVTVDFMRNFPAGYEVIIFRVHSATSKHGVFYFTAEKYDENNYLPEQFRGELRPGKDFLGNPPVFAFGAQFVEKNMKGRFSGAVVIGLGCFGAGLSYGAEEDVRIVEQPTIIDERPNLAHAIVNDGGLALIGWDRLVIITHIERIGLRLVKALTVDHLTIRQAVEAANNEIGPDPVYKGELVYFPKANGDHAIHLKQSTNIPAMLELNVHSPTLWTAKSKPGHPRSNLEDLRSGPTVS